jgi:hypothetical protein
MSKDRPNPDKLANELAGASAFFRRPVQTEPEPPDPVTPAAPTSPPSVGFDLNLPTTSRDSLRLATDETKALDAIRAALKWDFDLSVSKNDICRAALHWLLEDFQAKGDKSQAVARLKRKQTSR